MTDEISCPYCNAQFPQAQAQKSPRGLTCPRCSEPLPAQYQQDAFAAKPTVHTATEQATARRSNRAVAAAVVGVMVVLALVGLGFALYTTSFRRSNDRKAVPVNPATIEAPSQWAALGYLPANCNLLAGLQIADALAHPAGKKLLAEPRPPLLDKALGQIEKWTGFKADELSHVVAGVSVKDQIPEVLHVVAVTREPCDMAQRFKSLKVDRLGEHRGKPLFGFQQQPVAGRIWCPDSFTVVLAVRLFAFKKDDVNELFQPGRPGSDGLPKEVQAALAHRVEAQSVLWACGHGDWRSLFAVAALYGGGVPMQEADILAKVKTFGLSVTLGQDIILRGQLFTGDAAASHGLQDFLRDKAGKTPLRVEAPPADVVSADQWVTLQRKMSVDEARQWLGAAPP